MNRGRHGASGRMRDQSNHCIGRWSWLVVLAATFPAVSWAQLNYMPYADTAYQYDSNIFALSSSVPEPIGEHGPTFSDRYLEERAGLNALYDWSLQEFYANIEGRHFDYNQLSTLSHDEYLVHGGMKWQIGYLFDGVLDFRRERSMVSFLDLTATQLFLQLQSVITASANFQFAPDWRLQSQGTIDDLDSPRPGLPNLSLTEDSIHEGLRYIGVARLSAGVDAIYLNGHFNGEEFILTPRYHQTTVEAAAKYVATGLSGFDGAVGYTRRVQENGEAFGGVTGMLAYQRDLTGLTSIDIRLGRAINTYLTYEAVEVETGLTVGVNWKATSTIAVTPGYQWSYTTFPGADLAGLAPIGTERIDHYQLATLSLKYQPRDWLSLRLYGQYETRSSDVGINSFNRTLFGLEFELRKSGQSNQHYQVTLPES